MKYVKISVMKFSCHAEYSEGEDGLSRNRSLIVYLTVFVCATAAVISGLTGYGFHHFKNVQNVPKTKSLFIPQVSDLRIFRHESETEWCAFDGKTPPKKDGNGIGLEKEAISSLHAAVEFKKYGKSDKAKKLFQHAMALAPHHPDILTHYGEFLEDHDIIEAEHLYTRALIICPQHSKALVNRERTAPLVEELDQEQFNRIEQKRDNLMSIPEHSSALKRMKKEAYFLQIHHTAAIEGNTLSLAQTRMIIETRMAVGGKSLQEQNEILGIDAALGYINTTLVNRIGDITVDDILEIHRRLMGFVDIQEAGRFRNTQVYIADHIPPHPKDVVSLMKEFVNWLNSDESYKLHPVKYAALAHYKFVYIHPFTDGNGRTSRLIMNYILMRAGYPPVIIHKQDRHKYYEYLKLANQGDVRPFVRFIAKCAETILDVYLYSTTDLVSHEMKDTTIEPKLQSKLPRTIIED